MHRRTFEGGDLLNVVPGLVICTGICSMCRIRLVRCYGAAWVEDTR